MSNKIRKDLFRYVANILHFSQIFLIFLSFFTIMYWIFEIAGATFIKPFTPIFGSIKDITHLFYNRTVNIGEASLDFSFLVAVIFFLLCVWILKIAIEYVEIAAAKCEKISESLRKKAEEDFNVQLEKEYKTQTSKDNNFLFLIKFSAQNMEKDKFYNRDVNDGVEEKEKEILIDFFEIVDEDLNCQKQLLDGKILLSSNKFDDIDQFLNSIQTILSDFKNKYRSENWNLDFLISTDAYAINTEIEQKTQKLISLIKLGFTNDIICLSPFKERYAFLKIQKYSFTGEGTYQIMGENEEIFRIKNSK